MFRSRCDRREKQWGDGGAAQSCVTRSTYRFTATFTHCLARVLDNIPHADLIHCQASRRLIWLRTALPRLSSSEKENEHGGANGTKIKSHSHVYSFEFNRAVKPKIPSYEQCKCIEEDMKTLIILLPLKRCHQHPGFHKLLCWNLILLLGADALRILFWKRVQHYSPWRTFQAFFLQRKRVTAAMLAFALHPQVTT